MTTTLNLPLTFDRHFFFYIFFGQNLAEKSGLKGKLCKVILVNWYSCPNLPKGAPPPILGVTEILKRSVKIELIFNFPINSQHSSEWHFTYIIVNMALCHWREKTYSLESGNSTKKFSVSF